MDSEALLAALLDGSATDAQKRELFSRMERSKELQKEFREIALTWGLLRENPELLRKKPKPVRRIAVAASLAALSAAAAVLQTKKEPPMKTTPAIAALAATMAAADVNYENYTWLASPATAKWNLGDANWQEGTWVNGKSAIFPATSSEKAVTTESGLTASRILFQGEGYSLAGEPLTLNGPVGVAEGLTANISAKILSTGNNSDTRFAKGQTGRLVLSGGMDVTRFSLNTGSLTLDGGTYNISGKSTGAGDGQTVFAVRGGNLCITNGATLQLTTEGSSYNYASGGTIDVADGILDVHNTTEFLHGFVDNGGENTSSILKIGANGEFRANKFRVTKNQTASRKEQFGVEVSTGGVFKTRCIALDANSNMSPKPYAHLDFDGGRIVATNWQANGTNEKLFANVYNWGNTSVRIKEGGLHIENRVQHLDLEVPFESGAESDGGVHFSGQSVTYVLTNNTFNGGVHLDGSTVAFHSDANFGTVPQEPRTNLFVNHSSSIFHAGESFDLNANRLVHVKEGQTFQIGALYGKTVNIKGTISSPSSIGLDYNTNSLLHVVGNWSGKVALDPGDGKTNTPGRLRVEGRFEHKSGVTHLGSSVNNGTSANSLFQVKGNNSEYSDNYGQAVLSGGEVFSDHLLRRMEICAYGKLTVSNAHLNVKGTEILQGFNSPSILDVGKGGKVTASILRVSHCTDKNNIPEIRVHDGGELAVNMFYIDNSHAPYGRLYFDDGVISSVGENNTDTIGQLPGHMKGTGKLEGNAFPFFGNFAHESWTNICFYVQEGGLTFKVPDWPFFLRQPILSGAESDGGVLCAGPRQTVFMTTNTFNGPLSVSNSTVQLRYALNPINTNCTLRLLDSKAVVSICTYDKSPYETAATRTTQTVARLEGIGRVQWNDKFAVNHAIRPMVNGNIGTLRMDVPCDLSGDLEIAADETGATGRLQISSGTQDISRLSLKVDDVSALDRSKRHEIFRGSYSGRLDATSLAGTPWRLVYEDSSIVLAYNAGTVVMLLGD